MKKERIVIANSVGIDSSGLAIIHSPSRWTNSSPDRNVFAYYPWELAYASALLKRETDHAVTLIDGCLEKYDGDAFFERLAMIKPTVLVMEPATRTWRDDRALMERTKQAFGTTLIVAGQHATAFPEEAQKLADYVLIGEYETTLLDIVQGKDRADILGLYPNARRPLLDVNALPWPEDEDVSRLRYGVPGEPSSEYLEIQAYATRGCPMNCNFCVCRHLYYNKQNWRPRKTQNVVAELQYLKAKYPQMEGIFFDEEFHNVGKQFILDLSRDLIAGKCNDLKIEAMCAYYTLDEEMMDAMKAAGYYLLRVGIETAGVNAAQGINLGVKFDLKKLHAVLRYAKQIGLKMYGTFTFGAPGASKKDDQATLDLMDEIVGDGLLWRFQTSICTPQPGAPFYDWAKEKGYLKAVASHEYDGGNNVILEYPDYSSEEIMSMYMKAQKYYDLAVTNRFVACISESIERLKGVPSTRILVLRTARMPQMESAFRALRTAYPGAEIDVVSQPAVSGEMNELKNQGIIQKIYECTDGFFSAETVTDEFRKTLATQGYERAFLVYGNLRGRGYENTEDFLKACSLTPWMAFNSEGRILTDAEVLAMREVEHSVCGCR